MPSGPSRPPCWPPFCRPSSRCCDSLGELPVDLLQALFAALDPSLALRKFLAFAALDPDSERARQFVALEDWLNDGVPLAASVARECLGQWYGENATARGAWRLSGRAVLPQRIKLPSLAVIPDQDRIVPPGSALALAQGPAGIAASCGRPPAISA